MASEVRSINNLFKTWKVLVSDLEAIANDIQYKFSPATKRKTEELFNRLVKPSFLFLIPFVYDCLDILRRLSENMQRCPGLIIAQEEIIRNAEVEFDLMREDNGPGL